MKRAQSYIGKKKIGIGICLLLCTLFLCSGLLVHAEKEQVKISDKEYLIHLNNAGHMFISNDTPVSGEIGSKVFLTYTVEKKTKDPSYQSGVVATTNNTEPYPYAKNGKMYYEDQSMLLDEGYTYVLRFERTKYGIEYKVVKMKGEETSTIEFTKYASSSDTDAHTYYGIWFDCMEGGVSALLNHVRCYDEKGNDLGIHLDGNGGMLDDELYELLDVHCTIDSSYNFSLVDQHTIAISNKYPTDSNIVYMEYEVDNVIQDKTFQQGLIASWRPKAEYPHARGNGVLLYEHLEKEQKEKPLLKEGGKYFICFRKTEEGFHGLVQCTVNGKTETFSFANWAYIDDPAYQYFSIWFGESENSKVTADFKNFKCYDAKGNSLGIQLNRSGVQISHTGKQEDYSRSEAVYYCEDNQQFLILEKGQKAVKQRGTEKEEYNYTLANDSDLYLLSEDGKESYTYNYMYVIDEAGNKYHRMQSSMVTFVTDDNVFKRNAEASNGYRVDEPESPSKKGDTFVGWYLSDDVAFDFDTVVTESITLYAKWKNGDGKEYLSVDSDAIGSAAAIIIGIVTSVVIVAGCVAGGIIMTRRRKNGSIQKK